MEDKLFSWDEISGGLMLLSTQKTEDEHIKKIKQLSNSPQQSQVHRLHAYLILNFHETLSQLEKLNFRKYYLRKISPNKPDVVILQDVKNLVMFLLASPISPQFVNFFHLTVVDRFLRAAITYFQMYVMTWEELMNEYAATMKKAPNPLSQGYRSKYADEIQNLRYILGREYADLIIGCQDNIRYHHMAGGKKGDSLMQSQGEKDLRIFEVLISMTHRIVWIALERKHFNLIEIELHRLFRTDAYNIAERRYNCHLVQGMLADDIRILQGQSPQEKGKLLKNSPLIHELICSNFDHRLLSLGLEDNSNDERLVYLQNTLVAEEHKLQELGIKMGILGENRSNYDIMLTPVEQEKEFDNIQLSESRKYERESTKDTFQDIKMLPKIGRLPMLHTKVDFRQDFFMKSITVSPNFYKDAQEQSRKKWIIREIKRVQRKDTDTYSIGTLMD